jgi:hypothetical protein
MTTLGDPSTQRWLSAFSKEDASCQLHDDSYPFPHGIYTSELEQLPDSKSSLARTAPAAPDPITQHPHSQLSKIIEYEMHLKIS